MKLKKRDLKNQFSLTYSNVIVLQEALVIKKIKSQITENKDHTSMRMLKLILVIRLSGHFFRFLTLKTEELRRWPFGDDPKLNYPIFYFLQLTN